MTTTGSGFRRLMARAKHLLGWATADRGAEAEGALAELAAGRPRDAAKSSADPDQVLQEAKLHVRADHGDLAPEAEPERPFPADPLLGG